MFVLFIGIGCCFNAKKVVRQCGAGAYKAAQEEADANDDQRQEQGGGEVKVLFW